MSAGLLGAGATPTVVINSKMYVGGMSFDELDKVIRPLT
jgi:protein-disulfide isomerase